MDRNPVFRSLTDPVVFLKVPYQVFVLNAILTVVSVVILNFRLMAIVMFLILHLAGILMTRRDPRWFEVLKLRFFRNELDFGRKGNRYVA